MTRQKCALCTRLPSNGVIASGMIVSSAPKSRSPHHHQYCHKVGAGTAWVPAGSAGCSPQLASCPVGRVESVVNSAQLKPLERCQPNLELTFAFTPTRVTRSGSGTSTVVARPIDQGVLKATSPPALCRVPYNVGQSVALLAHFPAI